MAAESEVSIQTALRQVKRKRHFNIEILPALTLGGPAFFLLLMFLIGPFFLGIWYSFTDQRLISPKPAEFVGLRNYERMLKLSLLTLDPLVDEETGEYQRDETGNLEFPRSRQYTRDEENYPQYAGLREWFKVDVGNRRYVVLAGDPDFYRSLRNIFMFAIVVIPLQSGLGLVLALLVNQKLAGKNFFRTIYFSPVVTSMVVISIVWTFLYDYHNGMVNQFLSSFSLGPVNWLGDPKIAMWAIIIMSVWQGVGFQMVLWLAGLQGIPEVLSWRHLPIALYPDEVGNIFSGSAVIDWKDTAGFGAEAMVAIFTHESQGRQMQSLAYSTDQGRTWHKYDANPVLDPPNNIKNFRDPKVLWYDAGDGAGHWVMSVAAGNVILFYSSPDMKNWEPTGGFGLGYSATCGVWETPDLFELPVDGGPETRWVLAVGIGGCAPGGGSGVQYFIGAFDGATFSSENPQETVLWADYGADFYAAQSWSDAPGGRRIWVGWMNNWLYAQDIPTSSWRGALTIPRELALTNTPQGVRLVQRPVPELQQLRGEHWDWEADHRRRRFTGRGERRDVGDQRQVPGGRHDDRRPYRSPRAQRGR
jgi:ABC-type sugar transport system permease subunit